MKIEQILQENIIKAFAALYNETLSEEMVILQNTKKEFTGDFTLVVFPFVKAAKKSPEILAAELGNEIKKNVPFVTDFNVIKGFLNFSIADDYWFSFLQENGTNPDFGKKEINKSNPIVVEYSSPNTNKPLHLGHVRNNLLGHSICELLAANGNLVKKVNLINDRGIHICKSMLAWQLFGNGETPENSGIKGDHLVGKYYVLFDKTYKAEIEELQTKGVSKEEAEKLAPILLQAQEMLRKWEAKDAETIALWEKMNQWVYAGFDKTYQKMGVTFDKVYYESETYLLGKEIVQEGLQKGILEKKADSSVWANLTDNGLDEKLLLRSDGTSVYMTQDLGTALLRHKDFNSEKLVYVVGNEQNYHFEVLKLVLQKLGYAWAEKIYHLSYGMVELPEGKMKSREGTVVDADDLMNEMIETAEKTTLEHRKNDDFSGEEAAQLYEMLGLGALKYFILKVDPVKNMLFNPKESIDFNGNTAPFIQYTHARIRSIIRKAQQEKGIRDLNELPCIFVEKEKILLKLLHQYPAIISQAAENYSPAVVANYVYELSKEFNSFYQEVPILKESNAEVLNFRVHLTQFVGLVIKSGMQLLGIQVPERM